MSGPSVITTKTATYKTVEKLPNAPNSFAVISAPRNASAVHVIILLPTSTGILLTALTPCLMMMMLIASLNMQWQPPSIKVNTISMMQPLKGEPMNFWWPSFILFHISLQSMKAFHKHYFISMQGVLPITKRGTPLNYERSQPGPLDVDHSQ